MRHAVLTPSAAHRWLKCTPSARLEQQFEDTQSVYAAEGTFAHSLAEWRLTYADKALPATFKANRFYSASMEEFVSMYTDEVRRKVNKDSTLFLERNVDLTAYVPESFGHADAVILNDNVFDVIDFKYGAGVPVNAKDNPQLRLYALGVFNEWSFLYEFDEVTMTIVQPRNGGITSETLSTRELLDWGESVKPLANLAFNGKGDFKPGSHCKFCKASKRCKALADYSMSCVRKDFDSVELLSDTEITAILADANLITKWLAEVKAYALSESLKGKRWEGFKVVEGRSNRKITDVETAAQLLKGSGADDTDIWKPRELQNLTTLEKHFGKKKLSEILGSLIEKPPGAPTLVEESDKRPELNDFEKG